MVFSTVQKKETVILTLSRMGVFEAAQGCPLLKIYHDYLEMMKLGTVIPYATKTRKIYKSRDTIIVF